MADAPDPFAPLYNTAPAPTQPAAVPDAGDPFASLYDTAGNSRPAVSEAAPKGATTFVPFEPKPSTLDRVENWLGLTSGDKTSDQSLSDLVTGAPAATAAAPAQPQSLGDQVLAALSATHEVPLVAGAERGTASGALKGLAGVENLLGGVPATVGEVVGKPELGDVFFNAGDKLRGWGNDVLDTQTTGVPALAQNVASGLTSFAVGGPEVAAGSAAVNRAAEGAQSGEPLSTQAKAAALEGALTEAGGRIPIGGGSLGKNLALGVGAGVGLPVAQHLGDRFLVGDQNVSPLPSLGEVGESTLVSTLLPMLHAAGVHALEGANAKAPVDTSAAEDVLRKANFSQAQIDALKRDGSLADIVQAVTPAPAPTLQGPPPDAPLPVNATRALPTPQPQEPALPALPPPPRRLPPPTIEVDSAGNAATGAQAIEAARAAEASAQERQTLGLTPDVERAQQARQVGVQAAEAEALQRGEPGEVRAPEPQPAPAPVDPALEQRYFDDIDKEIGWDQVGGSLIRGNASQAVGGDAVAGGEPVGRTTWIGMPRVDGEGESDFWRNRPANARLTPDKARAALAKARAGEPLKPIEQRFVDYARQTAHEYAQGHADEMARHQQALQEQNDIERQQDIENLRSEAAQFTGADANDALSVSEWARRALDSGMTADDVAQVAGRGTTGEKIARLAQAIRQRGGEDGIDGRAIQLDRESNGEPAREGQDDQLQPPRASAAESGARGDLFPAASHAEQLRAASAAKDAERNGLNRREPTPAFTGTDLGATPRGEAPEQARIPEGAEPRRFPTQKEAGMYAANLRGDARVRRVTGDDGKPAWEVTQHDSRGAMEARDEPAPVDEVAEHQLSPEDQELVRQVRERQSAARDNAATQDQLRQESVERGEREAGERGLRGAVVEALGPERAAKLHFVHDEDGLPEDVRGRGTPIKRGNVRYGLHTPEGDSYIFTKHANTPERAAWTAIHEVGGHGGVQELVNAHPDVKVGARSVRDAYESARKLFLQNPTVAKLADVIGEQRGSKDAPRMAEEAMAELQAAQRTGRWDEITRKYGVDVPKSVRQGVQGAIANFVRRLKAILNAIHAKITGKSGEAFTDADVHDMLNSMWEASKGEHRGAGEQADQQVFHGSPYRGIEKEGFKLNKIGTGEGAQAYGWGIYFAGRREIAEYYRRALSGLPEIRHWFVGGVPLYRDGRPVDYSPRESTDAAYAKASFAEQVHAHTPEIMKARADRGDSAVKDALSNIVDFEISEATENFPGGVHALKAIKRSIETGNMKLEAHDKAGQLYHAEIPEDGDLLDNDAPIQKQNNNVKEVARQFLRNEGYLREGENGPRQLSSAFREAVMALGGMARGPDGQTLYKMLADKLGGEREASEYLMEHGVPGLKYKAGQIAGAKSGGNNYVIWDEAHLNNDVTPYYSEEPQDRADDMGRGAGGPARDEVTGVKNAQTKAERQARGLDELNAEGRRSFGQVWDAAAEKLKDDPHAGQALAEHVANNPRALTAEETALLAQDRARISVQRRQAADDVNKAVDSGSQVDETIARAKLKLANDEMDVNDKAARQSGYEQGLGLAIRQAMAKLDYSLDAMENRLQAAKGKPLDAAELKKLKDLHEAMQSKEAELAGRQDAQRSKQKETKAQLQEQLRLFAERWKEGDKPASGKRDQARQTQLAKQIMELKRRIEEGDYSKAIRTPIQYNDETKRLEAQRNFLRKKFDRMAAEAEHKNRSRAYKLWDTFLALRRAVILSGMHTLGKLSSAAFLRIGVSPVEHAIQHGLGIVPGLRGIAARAPVEGRFSPGAEGAALKDTFSKETLREMALKFGNRGTNDLLYGKEKPSLHPWLEYVGNMHAALKTPAERNFFARASRMRAEWEAKQAKARGLSDAEVADYMARPDTQAIININAYNESMRAVFKHDNVFVKSVRALQQVLRNVGKNDEGGNLIGKASAGAIDYLFPVVKIPSNYIGEAFSYLGGAGKAAGQLWAAKVLTKGVDALSPEQADYIMRNLGKQTVGLALAVIGYAAYQSDPKLLGTFYQQGDNKRKVPHEGNIGRAPAWMVEHPSALMLTFGANFARIQHGIRTKTGKTMVGTGDTTNAAMNSVMGLLRKTPYIDTIENVQDKFRNKESVALWAGNEAAGATIQPDVRRFAKSQDENAAGEVRRRYPRGFVDAYKANVPGLREQVPTHPERRH